MQVLWWLVPAVVAACLAMMWAAWAGRARDEVRRDDSPQAMQRMARAISKPSPRKGSPVASAHVEASHGVAVRRAARRPESPSEPGR